MLEKGDISNKFYVGGLILLVAWVFHTIGCWSPYWVVTSTADHGTVGYSGLFEKCANLGVVQNSCRYFDWEDVQVSHWFRTVQALVILAFFAMTVAILLVVLYARCGATLQENSLRITTIILSICAGLFIIGATITVSELKHVQKAIPYVAAETTLSWGFAFSLVGGILSFIGGVVFIIAK